MLKVESSFLSELQQDIHGQQQCSGIQSTISEQMQTCDSFSLPPGLYAPHMPAVPASLQTAMQTQYIPESQPQTHDVWYSTPDGASTPLCSATVASFLVEGPQGLSAEAQYFLNAQTKLQARQERLQAERMLQLSMVQQQQQQQMVQMQLQAQLQQQLPMPPPPKEPVCEPQVTHLPGRHA